MRVMFNTKIPGSKMTLYALVSTVVLKGHQFANKICLSFGGQLRNYLVSKSLIYCMVFFAKTCYVFRGATANLSQARPNILPQFFLPVVSYKSVLKPKIQARPRPWEPCQPWRPWCWFFEKGYMIIKAILSILCTSLLQIN